jgi:pyruvate ferredoxin oxidoreductase gamma subunit
LPNAALLGAFAAATGLISLESVGKAIREKFPAKIAEANILAAADSFKHVRREAGATENAQAD